MKNLPSDRYTNIYIIWLNVHTENETSTGVSKGVFNVRILNKQIFKVQLSIKWHENLIG